MDGLFEEGYHYKKAGVNVTNLTPDTQQQLSLFDPAKPKYKNLMKAVDKLNFNLGQTSHARETMTDIIDDRYSVESIILSSQNPVTTWYDIIGEGTIAEAILNCIVNSSHRIDLRGESLKKGVLKNGKIYFLLLLQYPSIRHSLLYIGGLLRNIQGFQKSFILRSDTFLIEIF